VILLEAQDAGLPGDTLADGADQLRDALGVVPFYFFPTVLETADRADRLPGSRVIRLRYAVLLIGRSPIIAVDLPISGRVAVAGPGAIGAVLPPIGGARRSPFAPSSRAVSAPSGW